MSTCPTCGQLTGHTEPLAEWAALNLYDAAMAIRSSHDGSGEPMAPEDVATIRAVLAERIGPGWRTSLWPARAAADEALRAFVGAVLVEVGS
jgi:hypothetical protein